MATKKHSDFEAAENLTSAEVIILQGGENKKAPIALFTSAYGDSTTASNGLTETSENIKLGGSLTENTTILTTDKIFRVRGVNGTLISDYYQSSSLISLYTQSVSDEEEYSQISTNGQIAKLTSYGTGGSYSQIELSGDDINITLSGSSPRLKITGLPTSASGLTTGMVWNDSGTLKIVL